MFRFLPFAICFCALYSAAVAAPPALTITATTQPPRIDGVISPGEWDGAATSSAFRQILPLENADPTELTEFWVTHDANLIYIAVRSHDSAGEAGLRAYSMQRDQDNGSDDLVRIVFDTFNRQNDGYYFALTAAGGKHDGLVQNKTEGNQHWDALWHGKVSRDAGGWSAEFAIPAKSIAFNPNNGTWGFNIARAVRRKQEVLRWSGILRNKSTISLPDLGLLHGVTALRQGRGLDIKPYASFTHRTNPQGNAKQNDFRPGLDVTWQITPALAATFTINTDFADAEVDDRRINLGRFSLFFPEKRSFFTQDASLFTFAGISRDPLPFFSRRIGLASDGSKVDLLGGFKLTGRAGPWTIGLLDVQIDEHAGVDSQNLFVSRVTRGVGDESTVGMIVTHGDPRSNGDNTLVGVDYNFVNSQFLGKSKQLIVRAALQATDSDFVADQGTAATLRISYPNEPYEFFGTYQRISENFDPALGFAPRTGVQTAHVWNRYRWYPANATIQRFDVFLEGDWVNDLRNHPLDRGYWAGFEFGTKAGDEFTFFLEHGSEVLDQAFAIRPGIIIPAGAHQWNGAVARFGTSRTRRADVEVELRHGGFFTGDSTNLEVELGWRPSSHVELRAEWELRRIQLPQGNFNVRIASARAVYTASPDLQFSLLAQYDNFSNQLGLNFRTKWTVQPGNEIFFIVNQGYDAANNSLRPTASEISTKAAWTFRF